MKKIFIACALCFFVPTCAQEEFAEFKKLKKNIEYFQKNYKQLVKESSDKEEKQGEFTVFLTAADVKFGDLLKQMKYLLKNPKLFPSDVEKGLLERLVIIKKHDDFPKKPLFESKFFLMQWVMNQLKAFVKAENKNMQKLFPYTYFEFRKLSKMPKIVSLRNLEDEGIDKSIIDVIDNTVGPLKINEFRSVNPDSNMFDLTGATQRLVSLISYIFEKEGDTPGLRLYCAGLMKRWNSLLQSFYNKYQAAGYFFSVSGKGKKIVQDAIDKIRKWAPLVIASYDRLGEDMQSAYEKRILTPDDKKELSSFLKQKNLPGITVPEVVKALIKKAQQRLEALLDTQIDYAKKMIIVFDNEDLFKRQVAGVFRILYTLYPKYDTLEEGEFCKLIPLSGNLELIELLDLYKKFSWLGFEEI